MDAQGTLTLSAANTYTGDTVINAGTIELAQGGSIAGNLDFHVTGPSATTVETLKLDATNQIGGVINGYSQGDAIDFAFHASQQAIMRSGSRTRPIPAEPCPCSLAPGR